MERNKAIARALVSGVVSRGDEGVIDTLVAADAVDHNAPEARDSRTHFRQIAAALRCAFPDLELTIEEVIAERDKVMLHLMLTGTHRGPFLGLAPTGRTFCIQQMCLLRFTDGKLVDAWTVIDWLAWLRQLGSAKPMDAGPPCAWTTT